MIKGTIHMKLTISQREKPKAAPKSQSEMPKGTVEVTAGANEISKRKQLNRDRGAPLTTPGMGYKSVMTQIRKNGDIPANLIIPGKENEMITVTGGHSDGENLGFLSVLREIKKNGLLATTVFELNDGKSVRKAIVIEISYHKATYAIEHLDFLCLDGDKPVAINMPINFVGIEDCVGIKAGGVPHYISRSVKVKCKPSEIPALGFVANIKGLMMPGTQTASTDPTSLTVADIEIPESIRAASKALLTPNVLKSTVVSIKKK